MINVLLFMGGIALGAAGMGFYAHRLLQSVMRANARLSTRCMLLQAACESLQRGRRA